MRKTLPESSSQKYYNIGIYSITSQAFSHFIVKPYTEIQVFMTTGENKYGLTWNRDKYIKHILLYNK